MEGLPDVNFSCVWSFSNLKKTALGKKKERFSRKTSHFFWRTRARERVHIYTEVDKMSGNTDVEKGNFAVKAGLAQVRDSHPRELARFSSVDGFSFLLRRRRHLRSSFLCAWRLSSSSVHFFSLYDDSYIVVSKESVRERRASTMIFTGRRVSSFSVVLFSSSFTSSSLQKKRNVNNKNARGHVTLFFILSFFHEWKKKAQQHHRSLLVKKKRNTHNQ